MKKPFITWLAVFVGLVILGLALSLSGVFKRPAPLSQDNPQIQAPAQPESVSEPASAAEVKNTNVNTDSEKPTLNGQAAAAKPEANAQIANPASANCLQLGGNLITKNRGDGGQYSICNFGDNQACEEWALMRGDCPVGGVKTIGFDTIDQKYCVWAGGQTQAESNSVCIFKDGSRCSTQDFFNGICPSSKL